MANSVFIALINPAVCAILAAALLVFWNSQRDRHYIAVLSAGFFMLAIAFLGQYASVLSDGVISRLLANALLIVGAAVVVGGTIRRYREKPPLLPLAAICAIAIMAFAWYLTIEPNIVTRILIINFTCGFLVLQLPIQLWKVEKKKAIDRFMIGLCAVWSLQFFLRTIGAVVYENAEITNANLFETLYWVSLTFSVAFFLLIYAVTIIAAIAIDLQEELRAESWTDPLSGLLNRRGFEARIPEMLRENQPPGTSVALILADLDHFKHVNDRFGHAAGDNVIVCFAQCLRDVLDERHLAGRVGGEEFAILLGGSDVRTARLVAEGLRACFSKLPVDGIPEGVDLSASYGVAIRGPDEDWEALLRRADRALYEAKARGRDMVVVAEPVSCEERAVERPMLQRVSEA